MPNPNSHKIVLYLRNFLITGIVLCCIAMVWNQYLIKTYNERKMELIANTIFHTNLEEPVKYLYEYYNRGGIQGDGVEFYLCDISNWDMDNALKNFSSQQKFTNTEDILSYCRKQLYFSDEDIEALAICLPEILTTDCIWKEQTSRNNKLAILYNPEKKQCLLIISCL